MNVSTLTLPAKPLFASHGQRALRVAVFGSGSGSNLEALLEAQKDHAFEVGVVLTDRSCRCELIAKAHRVPFERNDFSAFFSDRDRRNAEDREAYDLETLRRLEAYGPIDMIVLAGYMRLVYTPILEAFPYRILNIHPGDLSVVDEAGKRRYIGMHAVREALRAGESRTRSSVLVVDASMDGGPVLVSGPWVAYDGESVEAHQKKQKRLSDWPALVQAVALVSEGRVEIADNKQLWVDGKAVGPSGIELT